MVGNRATPLWNFILFYFSFDDVPKERKLFCLYPCRKSSIFMVFERVWLLAQTALLKIRD